MVKMMNWLWFFVGLEVILALGSCTPAEQQRVQAVERVACMIDRAGQIIIMPAEAVGSALEPIAALPIALAHAAAQAGCTVVLARKS
jgi:hypothetical protein